MFKFCTVVCFLLLLHSTVSETSIFLDESTAERLSQNSLCPGTIFTGPQNSVHCKQHIRRDQELDQDSIDIDTSLDKWAEKERCEDDLSRMTSSALSENWARQMLDAAGKPSSGVTQGNIMWLGDYFQCLNTSAPTEGNMTGFDGRYCTVVYDVELLNYSLPVIVGICVPDSCDGDMLMNITDFKRKPIPIPMMMNMPSGITCQSKSLPWDAPAIVMLTIISIFSALVVAGTVLTISERLVEKKKMSPVPSRNDLAVNSVKSEEASQDDYARDSDDRTVLCVDPSGHQEKPALWKRFLKCFCAITNGTKILDTSNKGEFRCVHGIRFWSMSWVILGHVYAFMQSTGLAVGVKEILYTSNTLAFEGITHGVFAVDSFFLLSGFLLTYLFLKEAHKKDGKINWGLYYFHRYWRLTPVYAVVLGFDYALARYMSHGPMWPEAGNEIFCKDTWWWNLLYINNFRTDKNCMGWSWFLANDMQFYVISPIFLYCLWRWPKIGFSLLSCVLLGSWITAFCISWHYQFFAGFSSLSTNMADFMEKMVNYFPKFYVRPYTRIGPYLIGMMLGYLLYRENERKFVLNRAAQIIGWVLATVLALTMVYGFHNYDPGEVIRSLYNALAPSIFTAALSWVIFTCLTGKGGVVNKILSYELFVPLSRLTYCAYLVHPIIIIGYYQSLETTIQLTSTMTATLFLAFLVLAYMTAFVTSLLFEAPFMALEKLFIKRN